MNRDLIGCKGTGRNGENDAAAVKADHPIPPQCGVYYFEVTIVSKGQLGFIGVGFSSDRVALTRLPGLFSSRGSITRRSFRDRLGDQLLWISWR